jgi:hypothetical protein
MRSVVSVGHSAADSSSTACSRIRAASTLRALEIECLRPPLASLHAQRPPLDFRAFLRGGDEVSRDDAEVLHPAGTTGAGEGDLRLRQHRPGRGLDDALVVPEHVGELDQAGLDLPRRELIERSLPRRDVFAGLVGPHRGIEGKEVQTRGLAAQHQSPIAGRLQARVAQIAGADVGELSVLQDLHHDPVLAAREVPGERAVSRHAKRRVLAVMPHADPVGVMGQPVQGPDQGEAHGEFTARRRRRYAEA